MTQPTFTHTYKDMQIWQQPVRTWRAVCAHPLMCHNLTEAICIQHQTDGQTGSGKTFTMEGFNYVHPGTAPSTSGIHAQSFSSSRAPPVPYADFKGESFCM